MIEESKKEIYQTVGYHVFQSLMINEIHSLKINLFLYMQCAMRIVWFQLISLYVRLYLNITVYVRKWTPILKGVDE